MTQAQMIVEVVAALLAAGGAFPPLTPPALLWTVPNGHLVEVYRAPPLVTLTLRPPVDAALRMV